jgi:hypothetical protein
MEAYDKDLMSSKFLGAAKGVSFVSLVESEQVKEQTLELFDKNRKKAGELIIVTEFVMVGTIPEMNPRLNNNCILRLRIRESKLLKESDKKNTVCQFTYDDLNFTTK